MQRVWRVIALVIAALLVLTFLDRFALVEYFVRRAGNSIAFAIFEALAIAGAGHIARRSRPGLALSFVIGYPIFGTVCFLVGLLKVNAGLMTLVTFIFALAGVVAIHENREPTTDNSFAIAAVLVLLLGFLAAQAPPTSLDELAYHLAVPHAWVLAGRAIDLPLISHSYFPLGIESADLPPLAMLGSLAGGISSHFLHLIAAIATTIVIQRRTKNGLVTAAIVATPALALTAGWSLVDWPLLGICVAFLDDDERESALAAGLLTKYTFIPFAAVVLVMKRHWRGLTFGAIGGLVFFVRNLILTGSPIAPFLTVHAPHVTHYRALTLGSYIFDGGYIDESLGASLLAALTAITGPVAIALLFAGVLLLATAPSARLLVPFFGSAATSAKVEGRALRVIVAVAIATQLFLVAYFVDRTDVFSLLTSKQNDEEFLTKSRPSYASIAWLNAALPENSRTLVIGLNETYWFNRRVLGGGNFDSDRVSAYLETPTPEALRARLAKDGVDHVAVFTAPPPTNDAKKLEERQTQLTPAAQKNLAQMLDRFAADVTARGNFTLFALRETPAVSVQ